MSKQVVITVSLLVLLFSLVSTVPSVATLESIALSENTSSGKTILDFTSPSNFEIKELGIDTNADLADGLEHYSGIVRVSNPDNDSFGTTMIEVNGATANATFFLAENESDALTFHFD
jgi:hypothetical protein